MKRFLTTAFAALCMSAFAPALASATTCAFTDNPSPSDDVMTVAPSPGETQLRLQLSGGGLFAFNAVSGGTAAICAPAMTPNVNNVTKVLIQDLPGNNLTALVTEQSGSFSPGVDGPPEVSGPEIEIELIAGDGTDELQYDGTDNADKWLFGEDQFGTLGANTNAATEGNSGDADDLKASGIETAMLRSRQGDDDVNTAGGQGPDTISPLTLQTLVIEGGNQNDVLQGGLGDERMQGGTQDDTMRGGGGNDMIDGDSENDILEGQDGADTMDGDTGIDFVTYATRAESVNVTIDDFQNDGGGQDAFADNVRSTVENLKGGNGGDFLTGGFLNNEVTGGLGNDTTNGGPGNDKVSGSEGADRVLGATGSDRLFGGPDKDNQVGGSGNDTITGNSGKDIFLGKKGNDRLKAADGQKDKKIDCGPGASRRESFTRDGFDPKAKSC